VTGVALHIPESESEVEFRAIRAQGPGGQHVNKASTAVHLRFNIAASSLPAALKEQMRGLAAPSEPA